MKTIWKYELQTTDEQVLEIPKDFEILTVQTQNDVPCLWCMVYSDFPKVKVRIEIFGTGNPIPVSTEWQTIKRTYIATYQLDNGLVFHVFFKH